MTYTTTTTTTGVPTLKKTDTHIIGFSYQREEDGELCDFTGEISCWLDDDWVKTCDVELKDDYNPELIGNTQHEWDGTILRVLQISGDDYSYDVEYMENITWKYTQKIDKRSKEYRSAA